MWLASFNCGDYSNLHWKRPAKQNAALAHQPAFRRICPPARPAAKKASGSKAEIVVQNVRRALQAVPAKPEALSNLVLKRYRPLRPPLTDCHSEAEFLTFIAIAVLAANASFAQRVKIDYDCNTDPSESACAKCGASRDFEHPNQYD
jgi:hypothetical protein